jgi:hypothetical protein
VRRHAELTIAGWGSVELARGVDARSLDQVESELRALDREFADGIAAFGLAPGDSAALDRLRELVAENKARDPELRSKQNEIARLAPKGLDHLRQHVAELEKRTQAAANPSAAASALPADSTELEALASRLKREIDSAEGSINGLQQRIDRSASEIEGDPAPQAIVDTKTSPANGHLSPGLRQLQTAASQRLAELRAMAMHRSEQLEGLPAPAEIDQSVRDAEAALERSQSELTAARLSEGEETIQGRLAVTRETVQAIEQELAKKKSESDRLEGALHQSEGLHLKRAAAAARVEELTRQTEREKLESAAYDRLYALFEECREKQLGAVMDPINDRVLRWMRLLRIGGYRAIRSNDQFLPDVLIGAGGTIEMPLGEESTGTIEQIGLMVRLALGSILSTPDEPAMAVLDDPLTHGDPVRLDRMRAVLKSAAAGEGASTPPAGPLQIMVFTCHPEWFGVEGARIIDLSRPEVMTRSS